MRKLKERMIDAGMDSYHSGWAHAFIFAIESGWEVDPEDAEFVAEKLAIGRILDERYAKYLAAVES